MTTYIGRAADTVPEHFDSPRAVILARALVQLLEIDGMLQRAVLDETPLRDMWVVLDQTHGESKVGLRVGVYVLGTEQHDVTKT